jgi:hypothetical protein
MTGDLLSNILKILKGIVISTELSQNLINNDVEDDLIPSKKKLTLNTSISEGPDPEK